MAKLEVELENVSDVFKKKFEKAKDVLNKIEAVVPPEVLKVASQAQKEGKKRLKTLLSDVDQQSEKIFHFFGIPTLKDFNELSKKVDALTKEKKKESVKKQKAS